MTTMTTSHLSAVPRGTAIDTMDAPTTALRSIIRDALTKFELGSGVFMTFPDSVQVMLYKMPQTRMSMLNAASEIEQHTPLKVEVRHATDFSAVDQNEFRTAGIAI